MSDVEFSGPMTIDEKWDYLAYGLSPGIEIPSEVHPSKKCALVATVRDEGITLLEWLAHNRVLGFGQIFIYSNGNRDGSDELLEVLHRHGIIHLTWNIADPSKIKIQPKVYRHAIWFQPKLWEYEWCAILDADEYIFPTLRDNVVSVNEFLNEMDAKFECDQVSLHWRWFSGSLEFAWQPGLLLERFQKSSWHHVVKSISKIREISDVGAHFSKMHKDAVSIDCFGEPWMPSHNFTSVKGPTAPLGQVNHYWSRSFQEYFLKRQRGLPGSGGFLDWSKFFEWRRCSLEVSPYPDASHISHVKMELNRLVDLPGVQAALNKVHEVFREILSQPDVKDIYEKARHEFENKI
jgi:hypothetical protein